MNICDAMRDSRWFGPSFDPPDSWRLWSVILSAAFALGLTRQERRLFAMVAGNRKPPKRAVSELWCIAGRRSGKTRVAALVAAWAAAGIDHSAYLAPGERAIVLLVAVDRRQAAIALRYTKELFNDASALRDLVEVERAESIDLCNSVTIEVVTNSFRSVRGRTICAAIFDETAFWRSDESSNPDSEVYEAVVPGLATVPGSMLIGITSPYSRRGLAYAKWKDSFARDDDDVLVVQAESRTLNPTLPARVVEAALKRDATAASAEWLAQWRSDLEAFVSREVVEACTAVGRHEIARLDGVRYHAFCDPAGGSGQDAMTMAIAHCERRDSVTVGVLDCLRSRRPPFSPDDVCREFADTLKSYGLSTVRGDRYAACWPVERFRSHGIYYKPAELTKSAIYLETLPMLNAHRLELLDHPVLIAELCGLERRTARGGKDSVDHAPRSHDDQINGALGALLGAVQRMPARDGCLKPVLAGPLLSAAHFPDIATLPGISASEIERLDLNVSPAPFHPEDMPATFWKDSDIYGSPF